MTKQELTALRTLPDEYVRDGTAVAYFNGWVVAINQALLPIKWHADSGWTKITWTEAPPVSIQVTSRMIVPATTRLSEP